MFRLGLGLVWMKFSSDHFRVNHVQVELGSVRVKFEFESLTGTMFGSVRVRFGWNSGWVCFRLSIVADLDRVWVKYNLGLMGFNSMFRSILGQV